MHHHPKIGPYELLATIGEGGTGKVYRAEHSSTGVHVALKTVHLHDARILTTIRHEIHTLSRLNHPGIVKILDHGVYKSQPWYAMELVSGVRLQDYHQLLSKSYSESDTWEGESPADTLKTVPFQSEKTQPSNPHRKIDFSEVTPTTPSNKLTLAQAQQWLKNVAPTAETNLCSLLTTIRRICEPLAYLHGEGFVHCDLKPDNILIRDTGFPVLLDFGLLQRFRSKFGRESIDATIHHGGTPLYMSPEQIMHGHIDARADLYSLGCILYEMLTGQPPYRGQATEVLAQHMFGSPRLPSLDFPSLTKEIDTLIMQLMARNPRERIGYADTLAARLEELGADPTPYPNTPPTQIYLYPPSLVGRQEQLFLLQTTMKSMLDKPEHGQCFWIGGPSGIGKTRLASVLARWSRFHKIPVISSECNEHSRKQLEGFLPLLLKVLDDIHEKGPSEQERILGHRTPLLSRYLPGLSELLPTQSTPPSTLSPEEELLQVSRYLREVLEAYTNSQPLLLVLDDLHWADTATLAVLSSLLEHGLPSGLVIVSTYRSEEISTELAELVQNKSTKNLELERLNEDDIDKILQDMLCLESSPPLWSRSLCHQAAGNPMFVVEYIRNAVEEGDFTRNSQGRWKFTGPQHNSNENKKLDATLPHLTIPVSLNDLLKRRIHKLSSAALLFASCVSVIGNEAPFSLLQEMSEKNEWELVEILKELQQGNILEQRETRQVSFIHEPMRQLAYELLDSSTKQSLHQKAAECLEAYPEQYPTLQRDIGHHWDQAGNPENARQQYTVAAEQAAQIHAHDEAVQLCQQALYLAPEGHESEIQIRMNLGESLLNLARYDEALHHYKEALKLGEHLQNVGLRAAGLYKEAFANARLGNWLQAQRGFNQVLSLNLQQKNSKKQTTLLSNIGHIAFEQGDLLYAEELLTQALDLLKQAKNPNEQGLTLGRLANVYSYQGKITEATRCYKQALQIHKAEQNKAMEALTLANLATTKAWVRQLNEAQQMLEESLSKSRAIKNTRGIGVAMGQLAYVLHLKGEHKRPTRFLEEAIAMMSETQATLFEAIFRIYQHMILRRVGAPQTALQSQLTLAQECLQTLGKTPYLILLYCEQGHLKLTQKKPANDSLLHALSYARRSHISASQPNEWSLAIVRLQGAILQEQQNKPLWNGEAPKHWPKGLDKPTNPTQPKHKRKEHA